MDLESHANVAKTQEVGKQKYTQFDQNNIYSQTKTTYNVNFQYTGDRNKNDSITITLKMRV